jgi:hypothetical protein
MLYSTIDITGVIKSRVRLRENVKRTEQIRNSEADYILVGKHKRKRPFTGPRCRSR